MKLRDILSIDLFPSARIRIDAQCEHYYYFYIDITEDSNNSEDPLENLSEDILNANVKSIVSRGNEIYIDVDISMVYIDRNGGVEMTEKNIKILEEP